MKTRELWLDFETWLGKHTNYKVSDLSWNAYVLFSKEYNSQRLDKRYHGESLPQTEKGIEND